MSVVLDVNISKIGSKKKGCFSRAVVLERYHGTRSLFDDLGYWWGLTRAGTAANATM